MANAVLLLAACLLTALILAPRKFSSPELDEAAILVVALALVTLVNVVVVHRFLAPLQALTALARRVDLGKPGKRIPDARADFGGRRAGGDVQRDARAAGTGAA